MLPHWFTIPSVEIEGLGGEAAARRAVDSEDVDVALAGGALLTRADPSDEIVALVQSASRATRGAAVLRQAGLGQDRIRAALDPAPVAVREVGGEGDQGAGLAFIGTLLLYIAILTFGYYVASGVVEEKSSRVIELVLSAIRPVELLCGKVVGIGLVGFVQLVAVAGVGLAAALATGAVDLPATAASTAALVAPFFVLGYAFYACAIAVSGAIVSRQEDIQSTTSPMMVMLVAGYLAAISVIDKPESTLATVCTFLPPVAPMVVPARAAQDALPPWELAVSVVLMLAGTAVLVRLAARIYERAVLRLGAPLKLREALRLAR
ncbi:MAG: ABC transporter permease [Solirubrobacteraceae bacterium]